MPCANLSAPLDIDRFVFAVVVVVVVPVRRPNWPASARANKIAAYIARIAQVLDKAPGPRLAPGDTIDGQASQFACTAAYIRIARVSPQPPVS